MVASFRHVIQDTFRRNSPSNLAPGFKAFVLLVFSVEKQVRRVRHAACISL
jgi:hypothetical protein